MSRKDPRTGNWYYRKWARRPDGTRVRLFGAVDKAGQPFTRKADADAAERAAIAALQHPERAPVPLFGEWFAGRFWTEWVLGGPRGANSPAEQESKQLIYGKWLRDPFGGLPLDRIDAEAINTFRARLRTLKKANGTRLIAEKTVNNILAVLSTPLQYAAKCGVLMRAPHVGVAKVERPEIEFVEFEEVARLVAAAREDDRPEMLIALLLAYEAGLRIGEIRQLQWPRVDLRGRTITIDEQVRTVRGADKRYTDVVGPPKGRRRRVVWMSPAIGAALRDRVRTGHVVSADAGQRVTKEAVRCAMERIAKRAGLADRVSGWHVGRHTFATHAALLGINPWVLQEWLGHRRPEETQLYADVARAHGRAIPPALLAAGADETDPARRVLAQLSARLDLESRASTGQRDSGPRKTSK